MEDQLRQGDVFLEEVNIDMPIGLTAKKEVCLAEGELTGHAHVILANEVYEWEVDGQRYVRVVGNERGKLKHEDHDPIAVEEVLPNITYRIIPQQEVGLEGQWRRVVD